MGKQDDQAPEAGESQTPKAAPAKGASFWQAHRLWLSPVLVANLLFVVFFLGGIVKYPRMTASGGWISLDFDEIIVNGIWICCNLLLLVVLIFLWAWHGKFPKNPKNTP